MKKVIKDIFLKLMFNILKTYMNLMNIMDLPFLPERVKIKKIKKLVAISHDKTEYFIHIRIFKQALNN